MKSLLSILLLSTLSMGNVQEDPMESVVECLMTYLPKLLHDVEKVYTDYKTQDIGALLADVQIFISDEEAAVACVKAESFNVINRKVVLEAVHDFAQCVSENIYDINFDISKLMNDYQSQYYSLLIGDVQDILNDTHELVECLSSKTSIIELGEVMKLIYVKDPINCIYQYLPVLFTDVNNILSDLQNKDYSLLPTHFQTFAVDSQALSICLKT